MKIADFPSVTLKYNRRKTATTEKRASVEIEVSFRGKRKWYSTGVKVCQGQWSDKKKMVINHLDVVILNDQIEKKRRGIMDYILSTSNTNNVFSFEGLELYMGHSDSRASFLSYLEHRVEERKDIRESTRKLHRKLLKALMSFMLITTFDTLTKANILEFDRWLHGRGYKQTTVHSYHKLMKTYIHDAIANDLLHHDPYTVKFSRGQSAPREHLTKSEIKALMESDKLPETLYKVRDLFLIQCFTGLSYADLMNTDFKKFSGIKESRILTGRRQKTGTDYYIVLLTEVTEILERYNYHLPRMTNQQYNMRLKAVADIVGINKKLTSHVGRHTAACLFLNGHMSIEIVAKILGHKDIKTTQIYAKLVNSTVNEAFEEFDKLLHVKMVK